MRHAGGERAHRDEAIGERQARRDLAARGDVAEHRERDPRLDVRDDVPLHHAGVARRRHGPLALPRGARGEVEIGADHLRWPVTAQRLEARAEDLLRRRVHVEAAALAIDDREPVPGVIEDGAREPLAPAERLLRRPRVDRGRHHVRDRLEEVDLVRHEVARAAPGDEQHAVGALLPAHRHGERGGSAGRAEQRVREAAVSHDVRGVRRLPARAREARERHHDRDGVTARDRDAGGGAHGEAATLRLEVGAGGELEGARRERGGRVEDVLDRRQPERELAHARERRSAAQLGVQPQRVLAARIRRVTPRLRVTPARDDVHGVLPRPGPRGELDPAQPAVGAADADLDRDGVVERRGAGAGEAREVLLADERPGVLADHVVRAEAREPLGGVVQVQDVARRREDADEIVGECGDGRVQPRPEIPHVALHALGRTLARAKPAGALELGDAVVEDRELAEELGSGGQGHRGLPCRVRPHPTTPTDAIAPASPRADLARRAAS